MVLFHVQSAILVKQKYLGMTMNPWLMPGRAGVEFFFVLSGFIITYIHWDQIGAPSAAGAFLKKRFFRIYPVYWIVTFVVLLAISANAHYYQGYDKGPAAIAATISLLPFAPDVLTGGGWTLQHEVLFYFFFLLLIANRRIGAIAMALWLFGSALILSGAVVTTRASGPLLNLVFSPEHFLFVMGMASAGLLSRIRLRRPVIVAAAGLALLAATALWNVYRDASQERADLMLAYGVASAVCITAFVQIEKDRHVAVPAFLLLLGDASYAIYITHLTVLSGLAKLLVAMNLQHAVRPAGITLMLFVMASGIGLAFHWFIERPILSYFSRRHRINSDSRVWIEAGAMPTGVAQN